MAMSLHDTFKTCRDKGGSVGKVCARQTGPHTQGEGPIAYSMALEIESIQNDADDKQNPADNDADPNHTAGEVEQPKQDED